MTAHEQIRATLARLKEAREKAHSGKWGDLGEPCEIHALDYEDGAGDPLHIAPMIRGQENTDFICLAANNWLSLLSALEIAVGALEEYSKPIPYKEFEATQNFCLEECPPGCTEHDTKYKSKSRAVGPFNGPTIATEALTAIAEKLGAE